MTKQTIANFLKQLRKTSGLSASDVVNELQEYNIDISAKTLYGYESGLSMLNADAFVALCKIYKCDNPMNIFGTPSVSSKEFDLIEKYRSLDSRGEDIVNTVLNREAERMAELEKEATSTVIDIQSRLEDSTRLIEYHHSASAGTGVFILGNEFVDHLSIPDTPENRKVDYAIRVSGNSMEPDYCDDDIVLVSQKVELNLGDVGIFIINNDAYIKEYGETELISRNPKADNIVISEYDNIVCMGKVIGKYEV